MHLIDQWEVLAIHSSVTCNYCNYIVWRQRKSHFNANFAGQLMECVKRGLSSTGDGGDQLENLLLTQCSFK
uniref:HDC04018 n=1 Tax=Drosophila melanogaster TaxID=7227 RepID=Q6IGZ8_DROME|nr:TPA_inf: HDC04018 [Drosophila melanogaster]